MIEVEKIRKALEPYREDLGRGYYSVCAIGRITGSDDADEVLRVLSDYGLKDKDGLRIILANDRAPDGFPRYQAVMAECLKIRAEQEAEAGHRSPVPEPREAAERSGPGAWPQTVNPGRDA